MSATHRSRRSLDRRNLRVTASDDISTCFIFQSVYIYKVLWTSGIPLHFDQTFSRYNEQRKPHEIYAFASAPDVFDFGRNQ